MKKVKSSELNDWGKREYKPSDLGEMVRGKYVARIRESTNVVVIEPQVAKLFSNDRAVNNALRKLAKTKSGIRSTKRSKATQKKRAA